MPEEVEEGPPTPVLRTGRSFERLDGERFYRPVFYLYDEGGRTLAYGFSTQRDADDWGVARGYEVLPFSNHSD